jgi:HEAT repeat protein/energy-coupling factor transporter ATP-binding protein EcfA2
MTDIDFQPYLKAVIDYYSQQRHCHILTDAFLQLEVLVTEQQGEQDEPPPIDHIEPFPVLVGLQQYALGEEREHVLLAGRPGSGKSTALQQLAVALAEEGQVPVLVQLKGNRPVPDLIKAEFRRMKQQVTLEQIDEWLLHDRLFLLLDGVNEIPNDDLRRQLAQFREDNLTVPMIFTTRDLSLGGDLGIDKRLEMQPLSEPQIREFVGKYLLGQGEHLLEQLSGLRKLDSTPLLLKMLCDVFQQTGEVPQSKGELFRRFDTEYARFKGLPAVSDDFRRFRSEMLQHLAWVMMQGDAKQPTEFTLTLERSQAEKHIEKWLNGRISDPVARAKEWLEDLLEHYLLQIAADSHQIEFHHQLFQEYYAAEALLVRMRDHQPDVSDQAKFQQDYLNYLKWTEVIAMALSLIQERNQALTIVQSAVEVDWILGARLAGAVKLEFQEQTVQLIEELEVPDCLKVKLLRETRSKFSIPGLCNAFEYLDYSARKSAVCALGELGLEEVIPRLLQALEHEDLDMCESAADALAKMGLEQAVPGLLNALEHENSNVRWYAVKALGKLCSASAVPGLLNALEDSDPGVRANAACALGEMGSDKIIPALIRAIDDPDSFVRSSVIYALGELGSDKAIPLLLKAIKDSQSHVRWYATEVLGRLGSDEMIPVLIKALEDLDSGARESAIHALRNLGSEKAIPGLLMAIEDSDPIVRCHVAIALGKLGSNEVIPALLKAIQDPDSGVREGATYASGKLGSKEMIPGLLKVMLEDSQPYVRGNAAKALGKFGSDQVIPGLLNALEDSESYVRTSVVYALERLGSDQTIPVLFKAFEDSDPYVRKSVIYALGKSGSDQVTPLLLKAIKDLDYCVRREAAEALGKVGSDEAVPELLDALDDSESFVRREAAEVLGKLGLDEAVPGLLKALDDSEFHVRREAAEALGKLGSDEAIPGLLNVLEDENACVRWRAAYALGELGLDKAIPALLMTFKDLYDDTRREAAKELGKLGSDMAISVLLNALEDQDSGVRKNVAKALVTITNNHEELLASHLPQLFTLISTATEKEAHRVILEIQASCKFYNYEIYQAYLEAQNFTNCDSRSEILRD